MKTSKVRDKEGLEAITGKPQNLPEAEGLHFVEKLSGCGF